MRRQTTSHKTDAGFAVIQSLIVFAIAGIVAALGIPAYAARAHDSVLQQNAHSLVLQIKGCLALDLDPAYVAADQSAGNGNAKGSVSTTITHALHARDAGSWGHYVNPLSGSDSILCQTALPTSASDVRPAVWITDDQHFAHAAFSPSATTRSQLAGSLLVVFTTTGGRTSAIDIYYIDASGMRSAAVATLGV